MSILRDLEKIILDIKYKYGRGGEILRGLALGPKEYREFEYALSEIQFRHEAMSERSTHIFMGLEIMISPQVGILPIFNHFGWYAAMDPAQRSIE